MKEKKAKELERLHKLAEAEAYGFEMCLKLFHDAMEHASEKYQTVRGRERELWRQKTKWTGGDD